MQSFVSAVVRESQKVHLFSYLFSHFGVKVSVIILS